MGRRLEYHIDNEFDGKKVSDYLIGKLSFSSRIIKKLKKEPNGILLNSNHARTIDLLSCGDVLQINMPSDSSPAGIGNVYAPTVYFDDDIVIFNKPAFMPVHPTRNHQGDTLANVYAGFLLSKYGFSTAFRPINRLDRDTTGLVVCGVNPYAASRLNGKIEKYYYAVACGELVGSGTIDAPIARREERKITRCVSNDGVKAVTHWQAIMTNGEFTLLRIWLETGRTHQIRVHFSYIGHPLAGDTMYGTADERISRQALHCAEVRFIHPVTNREIFLKTELPQDMMALL